MTLHNTEGPLSVLLLAGRRPGADPIADHFNTAYKVLAPVAGTPMILHVLNTLDSMQSVSEISVLTQDPDGLKTGVGGYTVSQKTRFVKSESGIADSILGAWDDNQYSMPFLVTTADNCLIDEDHINDFLDKASQTDADLIVGMVEKNNLLNEYPESRRTWLRFSDISVTGCNLFLIKSDRAVNLIKYWKAFESRPKKVLKLAWSIGPFIFLKYWLNRFSLVQSFNVISEKTGTIVKPVIIDNPTIAIDADKVSDIVQIESILAQRKDRNSAGEDSIAAGRPIVIFDLDRTITTHGTFLPFLVYYAMRNSPLRLLLSPLVIIMMLSYVLKLISRKKLKTYMQNFLIGSPDITHLRQECDRYIDAVLETKVNLDALLVIRRWRAAGAKLLIATASFDWMASGFAARLGFDDIIASKAIVSNGRVVPGIDGENCYGQDKLVMVEARLGDLKELTGSGQDLWFYTDHHSDIPLLELCTNPVAVNPTAKLKNWALNQHGAEILYWNSRSIKEIQSKQSEVVNDN